MASISCPSCSKRYRVPEHSLGTKVKCSHCATTFIAHEPAPPAKPAPAEPIELICTSCNAHIKAPAKAAGKKFRCPRCKAVNLAPAAAAAATISESETTTTDDPFDDDIYQLAAAEESAPAVEVERPAEQQAESTPPANAQTCPGCQTQYPENAVICTNCGINLRTGRSIVMTDDDHVDTAHDVAERSIWFISWILWFGFSPIASEGFGVHKPWTTRIIAIVTTLVSIAFFFQLYRPDGPEPWAADLMNWCGTDAARSIWNDVMGYVGEFHWYQLFTSALLHADPIHLAGNLVFLFVFGSRVNAAVGNLWTLALYPVFAAASGIADMVAAQGQPMYPSLGASGAIMGMAGMYFVLFPTPKVHMAAWIRWGIIAGFRLSLRVFAIRGFWVVLFYIGYDAAYTIIGGESDGVAHWAHLGGFIAGMIVATILLAARLVNARGGDIFSVVLGRRAWAIVGRPRG